MSAYDYMGNALKPVSEIYDYVGNALKPVNEAYDYIEGALHTYHSLRKTPELYGTKHNGGITPQYTYEDKGSYYNIKVSGTYNTSGGVYEESWFTLWVGNVLVGDSFSFTYTSTLGNNTYCKVSIVGDSGTVYKTSSSNESNVTASYTVKNGDSAVGLRVHIGYAGNGGGGMGLGAVVSTTAKIYNVSLNGVTLYPV